MAKLTVQRTSLAGAALTYAAAAAGGDQFANSGNSALHVKNGGASPITVTINSVTLSNYGTDEDIVISVPNGSDRLIGVFPKSRFDDTNKEVQVTYSAVTSVTVAVIELV